MKKRNRESISPHVPDSKKLKHPNSGVESPKRDGLKKSRLNVVISRSQFQFLSSSSFCIKHFNLYKAKNAFVETTKPRLVQRTECLWANNQRRGRSCGDLIFFGRNVR
jgi:hypothetical protein